MLSGRRSACSWSCTGAQARGQAIFEKWDLHAVRVGVVTGAIGCVAHAGTLADLPNRALTDRRRSTTGRCGGPTGSIRRNGSTSPRSPAADFDAAKRRSSPRRRWQRWAIGGTIHRRTMPSPSRGRRRRVKGRRWPGPVGGWQQPLRLSRPFAGRMLAVAGRRATSPAPGSHWRRNNLNFGNQAAGIMGFAQAVAASARPARRSTSRLPAATSASTTRPRAGRSTRRRCSASSILEDATRRLRAPSRRRVTTSSSSATTTVSSVAAMLARVHGVVRGPVRRRSISGTAGGAAAGRQRIRDSPVRSAHDCAEAASPSPRRVPSTAAASASPPTSRPPARPWPFQTAAALFGESASRVVVTASRAAGRGARGGCRRRGAGRRGRARVAIASASSRSGRSRPRRRSSAAQSAWSTAIERIWQGSKGCSTSC